MRKLIIVGVLTMFTLPALAETKAAVQEKKPQHVQMKKKATAKQQIKLKTEEEKSLYGLGLVIARQMAVFNLTARELQIVRQGINDGVKGRKQKVDFAKYSKKSVELGIARRDAYGKTLAANTPAYLQKAAAEYGTVKSTTGVLYFPLKEGEGVSPVDTDKVKFHQRGTLIDGREIENSYTRGEPDVGLLKESLPCLGEAVKLMKPGGKARITCPADTAFGKDGYGVIPPGAALVFEVELVEIVKQEAEKIDGK